MLKEYVLLAHVYNPTTKIHWWSTKLVTDESLTSAMEQLNKYYEDNGIKTIKIKVKEINEL